MVTGSVTNAGLFSDFNLRCLDDFQNFHFLNRVVGVVGDRIITDHLREDPLPILVFFGEIPLFKWIFSQVIYK